MERRVRVRFAPSPTGPLHIGGMRTALYNYLFAKKHGGDFLLRIEDTDQGRYVVGAEQYIINALKWCGISPNEGVGFGDGPHTPYRQSERQHLYKQYVDYLIHNGHAYYAFDSAQSLDEMRKKMEAEKSSFAYNAAIRHTLVNQLNMSKQECESRIAAGEPYVVRFKIPETDTVTVSDIIRGEVTVDCATLDDKVLYKSDGMPTYHMANVVDDYLMQITHVIRGEEWLPSAPLHVLLYRSLGWEQVMPQFAHLPLLLKPDGNGKLSKRDGDRLGFSVFPLTWVDPHTQEISIGYKERGYYAPAFANMIALLGWHPSGEQEIFSLDEMMAQFSLDRVHKAGAKFDPEKTKWFNQQYLKLHTDEELASELLLYLHEQNIVLPAAKANLDYLTIVCKLMREKVHFVHEIYTQAPYFFTSPASYDHAIIAKKWNNDTAKIMAAYCALLQSSNVNSVAEYEQAFKQICTDAQVKDGQYVQMLRVCITGLGGGAALFDTMALLGTHECINRLNNALISIPT